MIGSFKYTELCHDGIILSNKSKNCDETALKDSIFVFTNEYKDGVEVGFYVELVYHEPPTFNFVTCS